MSTKSIEKTVKIFYDKISNKYNENIDKNPYERYRFQEITKKIINLVPGKADSKILDIGCGTGEFNIKPLLHKLKNPDIYGIDISFGMIEIASKRFPECRFQVADAHCLPFESNTFDIVISRQVLEHLKSPVKALKEMRRVLKNDGVIIASTPSYFGPIGFLYFLKKFLGGMQPIDNWWTPFTLKKTFIKAGLKVKNYNGVNPTPYHNILPHIFTPFIKKLDKLLLHLPWMKYLGRTLIYKGEK